MLDTLAQFISSEAGTWVLPLAIIVCAFFLEDLTAIIVGVFAVDGLISIPLALASLFVGITLADLTYYSLGRIARRSERLARYVEHDFSRSFRGWLEHRYPLVIFAGHFVPGLRSTSYIASGFFHRPFSLFFPIAVAGGIALGTTLFTISYWLGSMTVTWMKPVRYVIAALFIVAIIYVGRRNLARLRAQDASASEPPSENSRLPET